jgi:hypothetical protein
VNPAALGLAATGVVTVVGGLSISGTVGRVLRNEPKAMAWALVVVLVGAALLGIAGLPATRKKTEIYLSIIGLELTAVGLIMAAVTGIGTAGDSERPLVSAEVSEAGRHLKGKVTAANLPSDAHFVAVVAGIGANASVEPFQRVDTGPDSEGKVELPLNVRIPAGQFTGVRVAAGDTDDEATADVVARCGDDGATDDATGCVDLPLAPIPGGPSVSAGWVGEKREADRVEVHLTSSNAPAVAAEGGGVPRIALVVKSRGGGGPYEPIYRGLFRPDGEGKVDTKFQVPVRERARRICVGATMTGAGPTTIACRGKKPETQRAGQTVVHLRRP